MRLFSVSVQCACGWKELSEKHFTYILDSGHTFTILDFSDDNIAINGNDNRHTSSNNTGDKMDNLSVFALL
jgi:hypothetical protein